MSNFIFNKIRRRLMLSFFYLIAGLSITVSIFVYYIVFRSVDLSEWHTNAHIGYGSKSDFIAQQVPASITDSHDQKHEKPKTILLYTSFFGDRNWHFLGEHDSSCPFSCVVTTDKSKLGSSDAVLFHARNIMNEQPGSLRLKDRTDSQVWILFNAEPFTKISLDLKHWNNIFNWTSMVMLESDVPFHYMKSVLFNQTRPGQKNVWRNTTIPTFANRTEFAVWRASNCFAADHREELVHVLQHFIPVDTYGDCGTKSCPRRGNQCDQQLQNYNFYLAFENSICRNYVTEKLWVPLKLGIIPVALGSRDAYTSVTPPGSYLHIDDFHTIDDLVRVMKILNSSENLKKQYFQWRKDYVIVQDYWCELCEKLHRQNGTRQWYTDLKGWFDNFSGQCRKNSFDKIQDLLKRIFLVVGRFLGI